LCCAPDESGAGCRFSSTSSNPPCGVAPAMPNRQKTAINRCGVVPFPSQLSIPVSVQDTRDASPLEASHREAQTLDERSPPDGARRLSRKPIAKVTKIPPSTSSVIGRLCSTEANMIPHPSGSPTASLVAAVPLVGTTHSSSAGTEPHILSGPQPNPALSKASTRIPGNNQAGIKLLRGTGAGVSRWIDTMS